MKLFKSRRFPQYVLCCILIIAAVFRLLWLGKIAPGISDDELFYVLTAKSFFLTAKDLSQSIPLLAMHIPEGIYAPFSRVPSVLFSALIGPMSLSLFAARIPYAIVGTLFVLLMYGIGRRLFDEKTALILALATAVNPWNIMFFRTSFDTPIAVFFIYLAIYLLLTTKGWKILIVYPVFILALYSYIGTSLIDCIFLLPVIWYAWRHMNKKKYSKQYLLVTFAILATWLLFILTMQSQNYGGRTEELLTPMNQTVAAEVNEERRLSIQTPLTNILINKISVFIKLVTEKYLGAFSPILLFTNGESRTTFTLWTHGLFYYTDIIFCIVGLYILFRKNRPLFYLIGSLIILAPLPSVFSVVGTSYSLRSSLLYPILLITIAVGASQIINSSDKKINKFVIGLCILVYTILISNFFNIYFFRNAINNSEAFGFSGRVLARYIELAHQSSPHVFVIERGSSRELFNQYIFFANLYSKETLNFVAKEYLTNTYSWQNIYFIGCPDNIIEPKDTVIMTYGIECSLYNKQKYSIVLPQLSDNGSLYKIYNDSVCNSYVLDTYVHDVSFGDLDVEHMPKKTFCQKYFVRPQEIIDQQENTP